MIKIAERYIAKIIFSATAIAALIITGLIFILSLLAEAKSIGEGDYGLVESVVYVIMRLPNEIYHFSPLLILLGCIIGLSILSSHRELAVMRTSGFSIRKIITSVLAAAFCLVLIISTAGEFIGPALSYKAVMQKENAQNAGEALVTAKGIWFHIDNNFIHIENMADKHLLNGVTRYQFDDEHKLKASSYAKTLLLKNHQWKMHNAVETVFYKEGTQSRSFAELPWDVYINPNLLKAGVIDPDEMSLSRLAQFSRYLEKNGLQANEYKFNFWQRIFQPFASLIMVFLAVPFVLGAFRTSSLGWRIITGLSAGFVFFILNAMLGQLSVVYQIPAFIAALLPALLFAVIAIVLCRRLIRY